MRWLTRTLVGLSAMVLIVPACGGGSDDSTQSTSSATEVAPATEAPPPIDDPAATATDDPVVTEVPTATEAAPATEAPSATEATPVTDVVGFEPDLVNEMAARLGLAVTWIDTDFETLRDDLAASRFDIASSNVTLAPDRVGLFGFTAPYFWDLEAAEFDEDFANIAFPIDPANPDLEVALSETFDAMLADGTYQSIYDRWFDTPEMSVLYDGR